MTSSKIVYIADLKDRSKALTFKFNLPNVSSLEGRINATDRVELCASTGR